MVWLVTTRPLTRKVEPFWWPSSTPSGGPLPPLAVEASASTRRRLVSAIAGRGSGAGPGTAVAARLTAAVRSRGCVSGGRSGPQVVRARRSRPPARRRGAAAGTPTRSERRPPATSPGAAAVWYATQDRLPRAASRGLERTVGTDGVLRGARAAARRRGARPAAIDRRVASPRATAPAARGILSIQVRPKAAASSVRRWNADRGVKAGDIIEIDNQHCETHDRCYSFQSIGVGCSAPGRIAPGRARAAAPTRTWGTLHFMHGRAQQRRYTQHVGWTVSWVCVGRRALSGVLARLGWSGAGLDAGAGALHGAPMAGAAH